MTKTVTLGEICKKILSGGTPSTEKPEYWGGDIPWITSADIQDRFTVTPRKFVTKKAGVDILPAGNVLVVTRVGLGKVVVNQRDLAFSQDLQGLILKPGVDSRYLVYAISEKVQRFKLIGRGATIKGVTREDLVNIQLPLPSLPEQRRIAALLDHADALRQKDRQLLAHYDKLAQSVFLDLFGDPVRNEKGWPIFRLNELVKRPTQNGLYVPPESYAKIGGVEMVHMSDAFYGKVERGYLKRVLISSKEAAKYAVTHNDLLVARRSLNYEGSVKPCLIAKDEEPLVFESSLIKISPDLDKLIPLYIHFFLNNEDAKKYYVLKYVTQSTISGINNSNLNKVEIPVPPLSLQTHFANVIEQIER